MSVQGKGNRCSRHSREWSCTFFRYLSRNMLEMDLFTRFCFSQEIDEVSSQILAAEEVLLEALCFDFVIDSPHADLVDLFDAHDVAYRLQDYAWSIAHDSSVIIHPHAQAVFWL